MIFLLPPLLFYLLLFLMLPATLASDERILSELRNVKKYSDDIENSFYYFPRKIRTKLKQDYIRDECVDNAGLAELAQAEGINEKVFSRALILFNSKMSLKKVKYIRETVAKGEDFSFEKAMDLHYKENLTIISELGFEKEMIEEMYYACKILTTWSPEMAWRLSAVLFKLMHDVHVGPITHKELKLDQVNVLISGTDQIRTYMNSFPENMVGTLSKCLQLASTFVRSEDYIFLASLLNPYDFDPQFRKNVYEHILGLQQWKRLHEHRMLHVNTKPHSSLERIIISTGMNAHFRLLIKSCQALPDNVSVIVQDYFSSSLVSLFSKLPLEMEKFPLFDSADINARWKLAAHQRQSTFGLPGSLRALFFMRIQEDYEGWSGRFIEAEYLMTCAQRDILKSFNSDKNPSLEKYDNYFTDEEFKEVCIEWLYYWIFLIKLIGQVNHQTDSSEVLHKLFEDYLNFYARPSSIPYGEYVEAIEKGIMLEGNLFVALARLFKGDQKVVNLLIEVFTNYEEELRNVLIREGLPLAASEANKIQVIMVQHSIPKQ